MKAILIVDDSSFIRNRVRQALSGVGYEVAEAADGRMALARLSEREFACVVTDLVMPEMDGFGFLEHLQRNGSEVPVVVLTADVQNSTRERCQELGARVFLNKPVNVERLQEAVEQVLAAHPGPVSV